MYKITMEIQPKVNITVKESYEKIASFIRYFINKNEGGLKEKHYQKTFSYYSFSNMFPFEEDMIYKKGNVYTVELRSLEKEFLDLKQCNGLETDDLILLSATAGKLYYKSVGSIQTETPAYMNTKPIKTEEDKGYVQEKIRENIIFRYLKSGINKSDDIEELRNNVVKHINIREKIVTIPFQKKILKNGKPVLYHCLKLDIQFHDNELSKEVEKVIYTGGLGKNTSNGFGFIR